MQLFETKQDFFNYILNKSDKFEAFKDFVWKTYGTDSKLYKLCESLGLIVDEIGFLGQGYGATLTEKGVRKEEDPLSSRNLLKIKLDIKKIIDIITKNNIAVSKDFKQWLIIMHINAIKFLREETKISCDLSRIVSIIKKAFKQSNLAKIAERWCVEKCGLGPNRLKEDPLIYAPNPKATHAEWIPKIEFFKRIQEIAKEVESDEDIGTTYHFPEGSINGAAKAWSYFAGGRGSDVGFLDVESLESFLLRMYFRYWFAKHENELWKPLNNTTLKLITDSYKKATNLIKQDIDKIEDAIK